jgi:hypothetical protein
MLYNKLRCSIVVVHCLLATHKLVNRYTQEDILSRVVTALITGENAVSRHCYIMGLIVYEVWGRGGISAHVWYECDTLVTLRHIPGFLFLGP